MVKVVLATRNRGKVSELQALLEDLDVQVIPVDEAGDIPDVIEDGNTFYENALKKAKEVSIASGLFAIADDSGLEVDALDGRPGVFSARYSGQDATDENNYLKLLQEMTDVPAERRSARFRCVMVACRPDGRCIYSEGACEGFITQRPRGSQGFGYDPVFRPVGQERTMAEMSREEKNRISHRAVALKALKEKLIDFLKQK